MNIINSMNANELIHVIDSFVYVWGWARWLMSIIFKKLKRIPLRIEYLLSLAIKYDSSAIF
jgi:hypothetical protein